ncbi:ATP-dependent DNA helicase [Caerostris darwini]|uniref:ATP-dependent DNA helicase n=1 Tax=Caerostris darwini TaxID=1538125 RepID=A0AAV4VYK3_9ARAC|nr:ATP-dependent DNA helicase [Caerostris darwini]
MYHNEQSLDAHYDDIAADACFMNIDILLLSETWTILRDTFELNGFDRHHLVSDLSRRRPCGVSIYIKRHLKSSVESVEIFPNQDLGIHVLVENFKTKILVTVLYAKPGSSDDDITDAIDKRLDSKNRDYKIVLAVITWEKTRLRTTNPPEDNDPRLGCGPVPWNSAAKIAWKGEDHGYPM